jgi:menaquinone-9 beta-reductase
MPNKFDVAIIGASLAGASAAYTLGNAGLSVALIDKTSFPRRKPCGEGLSRQGLNALERLGLLEKVLKLPHLKYWGYKLQARGKTSIMQAPTGSGITIQRELLDNAIVSEALKNPKVTPYLKNEVREVSRNKVILTDGVINADSIIIASGSNSKLTKLVNSKVTRYGVPRSGVTATFIGHYSIEPKYICILVKDGYEIYCTPLAGGRLNVSILSAARGDKNNIREILLSQDVINQAFESTGFWGEMELQPMGKVGIGNVRRECAMTSIYLAGDAKEEFDPIGGMGMTHALISGKNVADAIIQGKFCNAEYKNVASEYSISQSRSAKPMRRFTRLCYHTLKMSHNYPILLGTVSTPLASSLIRFVSKGI